MSPEEIESLQAALERAERRARVAETGLRRAGEAADLAAAEHAYSIARSRLRRPAAPKPAAHAPRVDTPSPPARRLPRQVPPTLVELEYAKALERIVARTRSALRPLVAAAPGLLADRTDDARADSGPGRKARRLAAKARAQIEKDVTPEAIERLARKFGERTSTHQRKQLGRQVRAALGSDVMANDRGAKPAVDAFVNENVALIRTIPTMMADKLEQAITRAIASGTRHEVLAVEIEGIMGAGTRRARVIARDQVGKLYGQLNAVRQQALGAKRFIWRTVGDKRVRPAHVALNGREFSYPDGAPGEGLPGQPILCRCYPDPVLDDLLAELDRL